MSAIVIEDLRVTYTVNRGLTATSHTAVDGLHLTVPAGSIFGFIGANGAGKSSTMRCLVGLKQRFEGHVSVLGAPIPNDIDRVIDRVGAIIDQPSIDLRLTGRQQLRLLAKSRGFAVARVEECLERVGLGPRADSRVKTYSLGMKQRLAIAAVLLKDPELLILDEPANGLDPMGMHEMRELLRSLAAEGRTVFISSHQISELEQVCGEIAIIDRGRCIWNGPIGNLIGDADERYHVTLGDDATVARRLLSDAGASVVDADSDFIVSGLEPQTITRVLADGGVFLRGLRPLERTLEDVFLSLVTDTGSGSDQASSATVISTPPTRSAKRL